MVYIENEGALFRGPARGLPKEIWDADEGKFVPYADAGKIKPIEWGYVISEEEAQTMMSAARKGMPPPEERPDLYDGYDCQGPERPASQAYWDSVMPEHVKKLIAERQATKSEHSPMNAERPKSQLDFGTIPDDLKKDLEPRTTGETAEP